METDNTGHSLRSIVEYALNIDESNQNKPQVPSMQSILDTAVIFHGADAFLGNVLVVLYKPASHSGHLSSVVMSRIGCHCFNSLNISSNSKYRPGILNLPLEMQKSKVRRALAVSILKSFSGLENDAVATLKSQYHIQGSKLDWGELNAGQLASIMKPIDESKMKSILQKINNLGFLSNETFDSFIVDTIYNDQPELNDSNNTLAFLLGNQLEQLFDPLTEYSPEPTERAYKPPQNDDTKIYNTPLMDQICQELITVQTNFTSLMVSVLQQFIVPLRIVVLKGQIPNYTTNKLNQILPPTIDEVTRINCIFLDMLKLAQPYGSYEILKACGTSIPYFYKALMRNQAATKNFRDNFITLVNDIKACGRDDLLPTDRGKINDIVHSSLHLTKLRLIIHRLYKSNMWDSKLQSKVDNFIQSCDDTISSFANDTLTPYNGRVFTPTGKILAEIANGWPMELQYGWLTRRVVAIFDGTDLLCNDVKNRGVIIVFSDHILFLSIIDDQYYSDYWQSSTDLTHKPSISDVLMHSLTNETPFTKLPNMKVKNWAQVNNIDASHFGNSIIKFYDSNLKDFINIYKLDNQISSCHVSEIIARSKILNKSQSFHLFLNNSTVSRNLYFVTHNSDSYAQEETKSPVLLLFNTQFDPNSLLLKYPDAHCILTLNFVNESTLKIQGVSTSHLDEIIDFSIPINDLEKILSRLVLQLTAHINDIANPSKTEYISSINDLINKYIIQQINTSEIEILNEKSRVVSRSKHVKLERDIVNEQTVHKVKSLDMLDDNLGRSDTTKVNKHVKGKSSMFKFFVKPKSSNVTTNLGNLPETNDGTESSIYVNSKFEFPMDEPKADNYDYLKGVKFSTLNENDGNCKGYKDSIDLMTRMDKEQKEMGNTTEFYDDMFEFRGKKQQPAAFPRSPKKMDNGVKLQIPKSPMKKPVSTKNPAAKNSMLLRSDSYYNKFQQMRTKQEELLKKNGISDISDLSHMASSPNTSKMLSSPSITRRLSQLNVNQDKGSENWVKFNSSSNLQSIIKSSDMHKLVVKKERIETINESPIKQEVPIYEKPAPVANFHSSSNSTSSVRLISSNLIKSVVIQPQPELESVIIEEDNNGDSFGSSIYESSIIADFGNFNSVRSAKPYDNPYAEASKMESVAEGENDTPVTEEIQNGDEDESVVPEKSIVQYVDFSNYGSDDSKPEVDFFGDLNLDLSELGPQPELTNLSSDTIDELPPKTPGDKVVTFDEAQTVEPQILSSNTTSMSLCSVLDNTTQAEILLGVWNSDDISKIKRSETAMGLQSLLNDNSYAYLNAVFNDKHLERKNLVRDPTHWNLAKNISH